MLHGHSHGHHSHGAGDAPKALVRALVITAIFMVIEMVGGYLSNSLALISDGAHMLTDIGAILMSLFAVWMAKRPSTPTMSFGYHRAEILGALASGLLIWGIAGVLIYEAVSRFDSPPAVNGPIVFWVALIGLGANLVSMRMLHSAKHSNMNVRAAYLHLLADSLGSVGAVIAGLVLWLTDWRPIDLIVTILFALLMLVSSWQLVKEAVGILMESAPRGVDPEKVKQDLETLPDVQEVHDLHIWTVASGRLALSVHLISGSASPSELLSKAHERLKSRHNIIHTTIQVEHPGEFSSERCYDCASG